MALVDHAASSSSRMRCGLYKMGSKIGKGNFAVVRVGKHDIAKSKVAIKIVDKSRVDAESLEKIYREIEVLKSLNHRHVIKLYEVMETDRHLFIVTEFAGGGELFGYLLSRGPIPEPEARSIFRQITAAVLYCHSCGIVHRDLKAENLLFDAQQNIKLVDFGFCNYWKAGKMLSTWCGSPPYAAPELFLGHDYDGGKADIWSLGVILYILVSGGFPFPGTSMDKLKQAVLCGRVDIPYRVSVECADLIRKMLVVNPVKRFTLAQIIQHRWFCCPSDWSAEYELLLSTSSNSKPTPDAPLRHAVLVHMQHKMNVCPDLISVSVMEKKFDSYHATYLLLCEKLDRLREEQEQRSELSVPPINQPRRGSRGSITSGLANIEMAGPTISASDLALLDFSSTDEVSSGSSDEECEPPRNNLARRPLPAGHYVTINRNEEHEDVEDQQQAYQRFIASNSDARRHTLCTGHGGVPLFGELDSMMQGCLPPSLLTTNVPFPLQSAIGQQPKLAHAPMLFPQQTSFHPPVPDVGFNRRASMAGPNLGLPHPASFAGLPTQQTTSGLDCVPRDDDELSAEEAGARYLQMHGRSKRHTIHSAAPEFNNNPLFPSMGPLKLAREPLYPPRMSVRRASDSSQIKPAALANLERLHAQALLSQSSESPCNSVIHLQRELQHLTANDQCTQLQMIDEQQEHNQSHQWHNQIEMTFGQPVLDDFEKEAQRICGIGGMPPQDQTPHFAFNNQLTQHYDNNDVMMDEDDDQEENWQSQSFFSQRTLSMLFHEVTSILDFMEVRYEAEAGNRRVSLEDEGGTRVELLMDGHVASDYSSAMQFRRIAGHAQDYHRLCREVLDRLQQRQAIANC